MLIALIKNNKELEVLALLKNQFFDLNTQDSSGKTILMYACEYKMHTLIDLLLEHTKSNNLNINLLDNYEQNALYYACAHQDIKIIEKLILSGIDIDSLNTDMQTALTYSSSNNWSVSVSTLLKYSPDLLHSDRSRRTPLLWAAKLKNKNMFAALLDAGVNPDKFEENGMSCLSYAADDNNNSMIDMLVNHGANINLQNELGRTVLHYASQFNKIYVIDNLIEKGSNINLLDNRGKTPLMHACENENMDLAKILIAYGAKFSFVNTYDTKGFKAVADNMDVFKFLLNKTLQNNQLMEYQNILGKLEGDYSEHIALVDATLLNQRLGQKLFKDDYTEDKKTKI